MADRRWIWHRLIVMGSPWYFVQAMLVPIIFPDRRRAVGRVLYVLAYVAVVVAAAMFVPAVLVGLAVVALVATIAGRWAGRSTAGAAAGLAPGEVPPINLRALVDRNYFRRQAARHGPVFSSISPTTPLPTTCIASLPMAITTLLHHEHELGPLRQNPFDELIPGGLVRHMRGDDHKHYRRVFADAFDAAVLADCRPEVTELIDRGLSRLSMASLARPGRGIGPRSLIESEVLLPVLLRVVLGLAPDGADTARAGELLLSIRQQVARTEPQLPAFAATAGELDALIRSHAEAVCVPSNGVAAAVGASPSFLASLLAHHPTALDDPVVLRNLIFNLRIGLADMTGLLVWTVYLLGRHPDAVAAVCGAADPREVADRTVMEVLRMEQSELLYRTVTREIAVGGHRVPAGTLLRVCVHEAHRDPTVFPDPDRFDPERFRRTYTRNEYAPLGVGTHACLGAGLIHAVAGCFVERLALGYRVEVVADGRPYLRAGWRPSKRMRVVLHPNR